MDISNRIPHKLKMAQDDINVGGVHPKYPCDQRIAVIGGGYSGTISAANSLKASAEHSKPIDITIYERNGVAQKCAGLAYGQSTALPQHYLNIQPHRVTTDRKCPEDCIKFLSKIRKTSIEAVNKQNDLTRHEYGQYITHCLKRALVHAAPGSKVTWDYSQVTGLKTIKDGVICEVGAVEDKNENPKSSSLNGPSPAKKTKFEADAAIIATGIQLPPKPLDFIKSTSERYIHSIYSSESYQQIDTLARKSKPQDTAVIIGTGLSAFDAVKALRASGFKGKISLVSTGCHTHFRYNDNHSHVVGQAERPDFLNLVKRDTSASQIENWVKNYVQEELKSQKVAHPNSSSDVHLENIMKGVEPYVSELISKLAPETTISLLKTHKSLIGTRRVGVVPRVYDSIQEEVRTGQSEFLKDNFISVNCQADKVSYELKSFNGQSKDCSILINATGDTNLYNPELVQNLWSKLIKSGQAVQHFLGGVQVDSFGRMIAKNGQPVDNVYLSGPMTSGDAIERRGRLGAFQINTGELRDRSEVAGKNAVTMKHGLGLEIAQNIPNSSGMYERVKQKIVKV